MNTITATAIEPSIPAVLPPKQMRNVKVIAHSRAMHFRADRRESRSASAEQELFDADQAARYCGMSRAAWYKRVSSGQVPRPLKIGGLSRWRKSELAAWIEAGCPSRDKWERRVEHVGF